jgi:hypothetical protein
MNTPDDYRPEHLRAMEALYNEVLDSPVTRITTDWLFRAFLLLQISGDDPVAAREVVHTPAGLEAARREFDELPDTDRRAIGRVVGQHWAACVKDAIRRLWHACAVLQIDPASMSADSVALHAATLLSANPPEAPDEPMDGDPGPV